MATLAFSFQVAPNKLAAIRDDFCAQYGYPVTVPNPAFDPLLPVSPTNSRTMPNPETPAQFMRSMVKEYIRGSVEAYRANRDADGARRAAIAAAKIEVELT